MVALCLLLAVVLIVLGVYTSIVILKYGMTLFQVFSGDRVEMNRPGQFNLDFFFMLLLGDRLA